MKKTKHLADKVRFILCGALLGTLTGCTTYVDQPHAQRGHYQEQPPAEAYAPPPPREEARVYEPSPPTPVEVEAPYVGIRTEADFYEPLSPYGQWVVVGSYGRCWRPARVESDWRPYCNGHWVRCDAGWYWASEEPWGWATYHYGRWDFSPQYGWFWVPQTQWAPAWVSWHQGGGYVAWAPLYPSARVGGGGYVEVDRRVIAPRAYVIVEERRFMEPVRPQTVIVNNTTIINKTVNITKVKVVNKTVINEGPQTEVIEKVSGRKVQAEPVRELRRKEEAAVVVKQRTPKATSGKKDNNVQKPARTTAEPIERKAAPARESRPVEQPAVTTKESQAPAPKKEIRETDEQKRDAKAARDEEKRARKNAQQEEREKSKPVPVAPEARPQTEQPAATRQPTEQKSEKLTEKERKRDKEAADGEKNKTVPAAREVRPPAEQPASSKQPTEQKAEKLTGKEKKQAQRDAERRARDEKAANKKGGTNTVNKVRQNKGEEQQTPEQAPAPPPASQ